MIYLLVSLRFRSSWQMVPQGITNFGSGSLATTSSGGPHGHGSASHWAKRAPVAAVRPPRARHGAGRTRRRAAARSRADGTRRPRAAGSHGAGARHGEPADAEADRGAADPDLERDPEHGRGMEGAGQRDRRGHRE